MNCFIILYLKIFYNMIKGKITREIQGNNNKKSLITNRLKGISVLEAGLEPARPKRPQDFKSGVSTSSTTRAWT